MKTVIKRAHDPRELDFGGCGDKVSSLLITRAITSKTSSLSRTMFKLHFHNFVRKVEVERAS
jgi:hypothetical protein